MTYPQGWKWQPDKCPCDQDFIEWVKNEMLFGFSILHMGTGLHHRVGIELIGGECYTLGLTISPDEVLSYIELVSNNPAIQYNYSVLFTDIHRINEEILPKFELITLFHLGEIVDNTSMYRENFVIDQMAGKLNPFGRILAYTNSAAHIIPLFDEALELVEEYKSLRIYKPK